MKCDHVASLIAELVGVTFDGQHGRLVGPAQSEAVVIMRITSGMIRFMFYP